MAPLPVSNTKRVWLEYTSEGKQHEMVGRFVVGISDADAVAAMRAIALQCANYMKTTDSFHSARVAQSGSNLSFPVAFASVTGLNAGAVANGQEPNFISWVGRSTGGRRVRLTYFDPFTEPGESYRWPEGSTAPYDNVLDILRDPLMGFAAIDGQPAIWNSYYNTGTNAYWQRKQRRG